MLVLFKLLLDEFLNDKELVEVLQVEARLKKNLVLVVADRGKGQHRVNHVEFCVDLAIGQNG